MNPDTVRAQRALGEPIVYGDATRPRVLEHIGAAHARAIVIAISDPAATRAVTSAVRQLNPTAHLIVRTRYQSETEPLLRLGASDVIPEEYETSVEIFARVLSRFLVPRDEIDRLIGEIRSEGYEMLRSLSADSYDPGDLRVQLPEIRVSTLRVPESAALRGQTLGELALRRHFGLTVLAIRRAERTLANPDAETSLQAGDLLVLLGPDEAVARFAEQLGASSGT
jgi:CPA2 family monovalent cation:H+ antiporter-2